MRKNSRAKSWVANRIKHLKQEGYNSTQARATALSEAQRHGLIKNPGMLQDVEDSLGDAEELARGFHGRKNRESFEEVRQETYRSNLAMLGELEELEVWNQKYWDSTGDFLKLTFSRAKRRLVMVAGSSDRKQLFLVGGDTELTDDVLEAISDRPDKDKISVGYIYSISYWADKHHLEGSSGKVEAYMHCFGEASFKNPNAREDGLADYQVFALAEKLGAGVLPQLVYDRLNRTMEIVGGVYEIRDEGIYD